MNTAKVDGEVEALLGELVRVVDAWDSAGSPVRGQRAAEVVFQAAHVAASWKARLWANSCPIGTKLRFHPTVDRPAFVEVVVASTPWVDASGKVVVRLEGRAGSFAIENMRREEG